MSEIYKFYVQMDGETYGPYTAREIRDLELLDDIMVTEESMNGQWLEASKFDFEDMVRKEQAQLVTPPPFQSIGVINSDGSVTNTNGWNNNTGSSNTGNTPPVPVTSSSTPIGWCILAFLLPIVGFILYFCWKDSKPERASSVCTAAWVGFIINILLMIFGS